MSNMGLFKKKTTAVATVAEPQVPATVEDEVASLLGEAADAEPEVWTGKPTDATDSIDTVETVTFDQAEPVAKPFSFKKTLVVIDDLDDVPEVTGDIVSALEAPVEFAHEAQPDTYDNPVLAKIKESLQLVKDNINDEQIVGDAIYNLMQEMKADPTLADMLEPEDYGIMARGLRESYHVVVTVKEAKAKSKGKKAIKVDEVSALLGEIMV